MPVDRRRKDMPVDRARGISDALRLAAKDAQFARDFVANPEMFREIYKLSDVQIGEIKKTTLGSVLDRIERMSPGETLPPGGEAADYY